MMSCWLNSLNKFCHVFLQENSAAILCTAGFRMCAPCYFKQQGQLALRVCEWDGRETRSNALHVLKPKLLGGPGLVGTHSCRTQADHIIGPELESVAELYFLIRNCSTRCRMLKTSERDSFSVSLSLAWLTSSKSWKSF